MKTIYYFLFHLILLLTLFGCSQNDSVFSRKIENNPGSLVFLNPEGFLWTTGVNTKLDIEIILFAEGGLELNNVSANVQSSDPFTFKGGVFPGVGGTCSTKLASGSSCKLIIEYAPTNLTSHSAKVNVSYRDALSSKSKSYTITADSRPILSFEYGTTYDFGNKFVGSSTDLKIRVTNIGRVAAESISINNLSSPFSFKGGTYPGVGGNCGTRLVPGQTCDILINYLPLGNGQHLQDIILNYINATKPESNKLSLIAWGFYEAVLSISSDSDNFGEVPAEKLHEKTYTVTHVSGDVSANLLSLTGLITPFSRTGGSCSNVLTIQDKTCTIKIGLNSSISGTWSSPMNFSYFNGIETKLISKTITAQTKMKANVSISPSSFDFGLIKSGTTKSQIFTVQYVSGDLPATNISLSHSDSAFTRDGGTCGTILSSGSCTIGVKFSPSGSSTWTSSSIFNYNNGITFDPRSISLRGNSQSYLYSDGAFYGVVIPGNSVPKNIIISNTNSTIATNLSADALPAKYRYAGNGNYPGTTASNACGTVLASGSSCVIRVEFVPDVAGSFDSSFKINYDNGFETTFVSINLYGTGAEVANLTIADKNFGEESVNSYTVASPLITLSNSSDMSATNIEVSPLPDGFVFRGGSFPGKLGNCGQNLGKTSCNLDIVFAPTVAKSYSGEIVITYYNGSNNTEVRALLSGNAKNTSNLFINNFDLLDFQTVHTVENVRQKTVKLSHGGSSNPATIDEMKLTGTNVNEFQIVTEDCPASLVNGESCNIVLGFKPTTSGHNKSSTFQVNYTAESNSKSTTRNLIGTGRIATTISSSTTDFGEVAYGSSKQLQVTLTKSGDYDVTSFSTILTGSGFSYYGGSYPGIGGTCSWSWSSSCRLVLSYSPTTSGLQTGTLKLNFYNGYTSPSHDISLSGTGVAVSNLNFLSGTYDFGKVIQTQKSEKTITLKNSGLITANFTAPTIVAPYSFKGGTYPGTGGTCSTSLAVNQTCTMVIEFSPTTTGVKQQNLTINYNNGNSNTSTSTSLTGEGLAQAIISISGGNPYNFGITNINGTINETFILTNSGSVNGTSLGGTFSSVFSFLGNTFPGTGGTCTQTLNAGSTCTIVLSFKPTAAQSYSGTFTLNYYDGLRTQTELKNLSGTGSKSLNYNFFLSQLEPKETSIYQHSIIPSLKIEDINQDGLNEWLEPITATDNYPKYFYNFVDGQNPNNVLVRIYNLFPSGIIQGISSMPLLQDYNNDGYNDLLIGIYHKNSLTYVLRGYDIISGKNGNVIERYLPPSYQ